LRASKDGRERMWLLFPLKSSRHLPRKEQNGVWTLKGCPVVESKNGGRHERFCRNCSGVDDGDAQRTGACVERSNARSKTPEFCSHQGRAGGRRPAWWRRCARSARWRGCRGTHHRGSSSGCSSGCPGRCPPRPMGTPRIQVAPRRRDRSRSSHRLRRSRNGSGVGRCCAGSGLLLVLYRSQPDPGFLGRLSVTRSGCFLCDLAGCR
jgi:hypothetical protein